MNNQIDEYRKILQATDIQKTYRMILQTMADVQRAFSRMSEYQVSSNFYQGKIDYTFFSFTTEVTRKRQLKYIVAFNHEKTHFEVWLSGRNRESMVAAKELFRRFQVTGYRLSDDQERMTSIIVKDIAKNADYDHLDQLIILLEREVSEFATQIELYL